MKNPKITLTDAQALELCDEVFEKFGKKFFRGMQCRFCRRYADKRNDVRLRCVFNAEGNRGCNVINNYLKKERMSSFTQKGD